MSRGLKKRDDPLQEWPKHAPEKTICCNKKGGTSQNGLSCP